MPDSKGEDKLIRRKRIVAVLSLITLIGLVSFLTYFLAVRFSKIAKSGEEFRDFIQGYGAWGVLVAIAIQVIQVFVALIPGEFVEIGMGYAYGWIAATFLCLAGVAIGSSFIFKLVKKFGIRFIELFVSSDKINDLRLIRDEERLHRLTFILFLIPGTPKDLITYFIGLTRMTLKDFLTITLFARIPSIVISTLGGNFIGEGKYIAAFVLLIAAAIISILGLKLYNILMKKLKKRAEKKGRLFGNIHRKK